MHPREQLHLLQNEMRKSLLSNGMSICKLQSGYLSHIQIGLIIILLQYTKILARVSFSIEILVILQNTLSIDV
uniref:Ovule protein n=1 Tax=Heterorhabditis bacteriophora TaxID=37862 RepID=A0A1I7WYH8_HETBA